MKRILIVGDSNTWGYIPGTLDWTTFTYQQFPYQKRWVGILERELAFAYELVLEAYPGRTIMSDDETQPNTNSMKVLKNILISKAFPDWVVIMLGINDLKTAYQLTPQQIMHNMEKMCKFIQENAMNHGNKFAKILLVAPPIVFQKKLSQEWQIYYMGRDIEKDSTQLVFCFQELAKKNNFWFCDASKPKFSSSSDGLHLDECAHRWLALKLKQIIQQA